jgi:hypothetical protein
MMKTGMLGFNCQQPSQAAAWHYEAVAADAGLPASLTPRKHSSAPTMCSYRKPQTAPKLNARQAHLPDHMQQIRNQMLGQCAHDSNTRPV